MRAQDEQKDLPRLLLGSLEAAYREGRSTPGEAVVRWHAELFREDQAGVWIHRASLDDLRARARELEAARAAGATLPLYGVPFAVKDNIDVAGMPTTAACPAFAYVPSRSATVVERLLAAGAICLGKTNLDQFATGLVGTRTPYGIPRNPYDARYVPGGSSSGSAVAVARGVVSFALGTDTAGSGRVPAGFNHIVGLKPSRGLLGTTGVVPACRSLDCVSIFAGTPGDARTVFALAKHLDEDDPYARAEAELPRATPLPGFRFGVPRPADLDFAGDAAYAALFAAAVERLVRLGGEPVPVDLGPFQEAAALLYQGPWVAERLEAAGPLLAARPETLDPVVRAILLEARRFDAPAVFRAQARLAFLRRITAAVLRQVACLVVPTAPTIYTVEEVKADPVSLNARLGRYTNFVNLLDLCGVAVPAGFRPDGLPFGITLLGPAGTEAGLLAGAEAFADGAPVARGAARAADAETGTLAVVGAHLTGGPLNHQLTDRGATCVATTTTAPRYRLFALPGTTPAKPGLVRVAGPEGRAIELEVWRLSPAALGSFLLEVPRPLCLGSVELVDGTWVKGFLCEAHAVVGARDVSSFGGWRAYQRSVRETAK